MSIDKARWLCEKAFCILLFCLINIYYFEVMNKIVFIFTSKLYFKYMKKLPAGTSYILYTV